jgi:hypothetical protein
MNGSELSGDKLGNVMISCSTERSEYTDGVSNLTKAQAQLIYISTMAMKDYGLARLSELTDQLGSAEATEINTRIEEIVTILSDLAASLRDGESSPKLELTFRIRTRTATGVYITHYAGQITVVKDRERRISVVLAGWTCGSKLWCRKLSVLINSGSFS